MFKYLLISKYLRRKLAPLFAALAVMMCTMMVIVVMSVMGGFLDLLRTSAHQLTGDVSVRSGSFGGMPYYEQLIEKLEALSEVAHASPIIRGYGLLKIGPYTNPVRIEGVRPRDLEHVISFRETLQWESDDLPYRTQGMDIKELAMDLAFPEEMGLASPPKLMIVGIEVNPSHRRDENGQYSARTSLVMNEVVLTVLPVSQQGAVIDSGVKPKRFVAINEFKSGLYEVDANVVFVAFDELQKMLVMNAAEATIDMETGEVIGGPSPARASEIVVKAAAGVTVLETQKAVTIAVDRFAAEQVNMYPPFVETWDQRHSTLLSAVQNEKGLVTFLFVIISAVAVVMVATTFYMIVLEKTRDIGVLRAIGASRFGICNLFLGYGLTIGTLGALLGFGLAVLIVTHLNEIQYLLNAWFGWQMWDPQIYFFDRIPDRVDWLGAGCVVLGAILSSVVGALIPAIIAARLDPVEALRYE